MNGRMLLCAVTAALAAALLSIDSVGAAPDPMVAYGAYVAKSGDCAACHTAPGGKAYAGGLAIKSPVGTIYASNITPSKTKGIGNYTLVQFTRAMREGIRADGANLYPAMPYTNFAVYSDRDIAALYAYLMKGVQPFDTAPPETKLPFPANIRLSMAVWNLPFLQSEGFKPVAEQSAMWNRGKYLVEGAGHCSSCHSPRSYLMNEETSRAFTGSQVGAWYAPNITRDPVNGIGRWSAADLSSYLRTGVAQAQGARAAGTMAEAIQKSFSGMTAADIDAIVTYVRTIPASKDANPSGVRYNRGSAYTLVAETRGTTIGDGGGEQRGARLFQASCASCHAVAGQGSRDGYYPSLFRSSTTGAPNSNLVSTILNGVNRTTGAGQAFMPGFGGSPSDMNQMTDADIVLVANYVRTQYGGLTAPVTTDQVATVRAGGPTSSLIRVAQIGIGLAVLVGLGLAVWLFQRIRRRRYRVQANVDS